MTFEKSKRHHFVLNNGVKVSVKAQGQKRALNKLPSCIDIRTIRTARVPTSR